jgi:hypothetical protein
MLKRIAGRPLWRVGSDFDRYPSGGSRRLRRRRAGLTFGLLVVLCGLMCDTAGSEEPKDQPVEGPGVMLRGAHIEGQGIPQVLPITPIELFPYIYSDEALFFSDVRFFPTNNGTFGGNAGLGYRFYNNSLDTLFGASVWYDADDTRRLYFQQAGVSLEAYHSLFDWRSNVYIPFGSTSRTSFLGILPGSTQFVGENIAYSQQHSWYAAMKGFDMEAGIPVPGEFSRDHGLRVYGGGYYYADNDNNSIAGVSSRIQANIIAGLDAHVQIMYDPYYETRAFVGLAWTFGPIHRSKISQSTPLGRIGEHVTRNYTVVAPERSTTNNLLAINPATGNPYRVSHVDSSGGGSDNGTVSNPFHSVAAAQAAHRDFIFVHSGSTFTGSNASVVLGPGDRVLGDYTGAAHYISVPELGNILLPHAGGNGNRPVFMGSSGDSIVLANNSEFSGFSIVNAGGNAISASGVQNAILNDIRIDGASGNGLSFVNSSGSYQLHDVVIANSGGDGANFNGGSASITWDGRIVAGGGHHLVVANMNGGNVDLSGVTFDGSGGKGVLLSNVSGSVTFNNLTLNNPTTDGILIDGGSGQFAFNGTTTVAHSGGPAIAIHNLQQQANVAFGNVNIDHRQGRGVEIDHSDGAVNFSGSTNITNEDGTNASAVSIENSPGLFSMNTVNITDATGHPAVNLQNNTGTTTFQTLNITANGGAGLYVRNGGTLAINPTAGDGSVDTNLGGTISTSGGSALDIAGTNLNINLQSVSAQNASTGVRIVNTSGYLNVFGNNSEGTGGRILNSTTAMFLQDSQNLSFKWMTLDTNNLGIHADNVNSLALQNSVIKHTATYGIDAYNTTQLALKDSSLTTNGSGNLRAQFDTRRSYSYSFSGTEFKTDAPNNVILAGLGRVERLHSQPVGRPRPVRRHPRRVVVHQGELGRQHLGLCYQHDVQCVRQLQYRALDEKRLIDRANHNRLVQ